MCGCGCVYVRGDFKADSVEQTEPGHRRIERWKDTERQPWGGEKVGETEKSERKEGNDEQDGGKDGVRGFS